MRYQGRHQMRGAGEVSGEEVSGEEVSGEVSGEVSDEWSR